MCNYYPAVFVARPSLLGPRKVKGVDYDVVPCGPTNKPPWLLQEVAGQMPCVPGQNDDDDDDGDR